MLRLLEIRANDPSAGAAVTTGSAHLWRKPEKNW